MTIAILATLLLGLLFVATYIFGKNTGSNSYMVVARFDAGSAMESKLAKFPGYQLKNKTMSGSFTEVVAELRLSKKGMEDLDALREVDGVHEISVMKSVSNSVL